MPRKQLGSSSTSTMRSATAAGTCGPAPYSNERTSSADSECHAVTARPGAAPGCSSTGTPERDMFRDHYLKTNGGASSSSRAPHCRAPALATERRLVQLGGIGVWHRRSTSKRFERARWGRIQASMALSLPCRPAFASAPRRVSVRAHGNPFLAIETECDGQVGTGHFR
jgi:hypothetical protein